MAAFFNTLYGRIGQLAQQKNVLLSCCLLAIAFYFLPYIICGTGSPLMIHDNLDSNVVWAKLFLGSGHCFSADNTSVKQMMNGVSPVSLCSSNDLSLLFLKGFGMYWGYIINKIIMSLTAFAGMYLLLSRYVITEKKYIALQCTVALIFALLPFWSFTLSVAGMPLLMYAFLNIRKGNTAYYNWLILLLMAFYSSLIFSGFFFLLLMSMVFVYDALKEKKINKAFLLSLTVLSCGYVISHYRLFYSFLVKSGYVTHRFEMRKSLMSFSKAFRSSRDLFTDGQYHAHSLHYFILPAVLIFLLLIRKDLKKYTIYLLILLFLVLTSLFYGFLNWGIINAVFYKIGSVVPIQFQRFHTLHPMFWYVLFAISLLVIIMRLGKYGVSLAALFLVLQFSYVVKNHELIVNRHSPSFKAYYDEALFGEIRQFIGKEQSTYKVMSLGLDPAVSLYNGFYTLDGYVADYSLDYKHRFRKIIAPELDKDPVLKKYFDNWGSRCYAFSSELGENFMYGKNNTKEIQHPAFDLDAFRELGGRYIISAVKISAINNERYVLQKTFESESSFWKIYLYEIV